MKVARTAVGTSPLSFPAQAVSQSVKETEEWGMGCMDFFDYSSSVQSREKFDIWRNYRQVSGDVDIRDYQYYTDPLSLGAAKDQDYGTTFDIVHFPVMNTPVQTILGERIKRPLNYTVVNETAKARNEQLRVKTEMLREWAIGIINQRVQAKVQQQGVDPQSEQGQALMQQFTPEAIQDYMDKDYTDVAEQVGMRILGAVWRENVMDDELLDGFKHAIISAREFYHVYVSGGKIKIKNLSPLDVFYHRSPSVKWISEGQYAGFRLYLTPSSIIDLFYDELKYDDLVEIEAMVNPNQKAKQNTASSTGIGSIHYDTGTFSDNFGNLYDNFRMDNLNEMIHDYNRYGERAGFFNTYGLVKVVKAYWKSYRKVGFLYYFDEGGREQKTIVDDNYTPNKAVGERVEWKVINQVYEGGKVGDTIYMDVKPYKDAIFDIGDLDYCPLPIEGCTYNDTHSKPVSAVDLMRPWNELYDIVAYELKKDMNSSLGKVLFMSVDHIPDIPGFTWEKWYYWAKELKIAWVKQPPRGGNTFNQFSAADMSFAEQIVAKMEVLSRIKAECEAFAGFSQSRIGNPTSTDTVGQSTQSLMASVNQTEYWFFKHFKLGERLLNFVLRLSRHVLREYDTYDYLFDDMELGYVKGLVNAFGTDRLRCYVSNSLEDLQNKQKLEAMLNLAVSNGADVMDAGDILLAKTVSETRNLFQMLRRKKKEYEELVRQHEQTIVDKQVQDKADQRQWDKEKHYSLMENNLQRQYIQTFGYREDNMGDSDANGTPDILEYQRVSIDQNYKEQDIQIKRRKQYMDEVFRGRELQLEDKALAVKEKDIASKERIAAKNKNRYDK